jgi:AraC-like DNA-binding protein
MSKFVSIGLIPAPIPEFPPHSHSATWEIVLYTHGKGVATVGSTEIPFTPGTIICMPPRIPHLEKSEAGYTNIFIHTDEYPAQGRVPVFKDTPERPFYNVAMMLNHEAHLKQSNWRLVTQDLFDILMLYLNRWEEREAVHPMVDRLKTAIVENLPNTEFDLSEAVNRLPISADHLRKLFCKATGKTPLDYMTQLRLDEARHLLRIGGFSVKEVAVRVGYRDQYYFSRLFRKVCGMSPTEYIQIKS